MNESLPFVTTWMQLGGIKISEISEREISYDSPTCVTWKMNKENRTKQLDIENKLVIARREGGGKRNILSRSIGTNFHLYNKSWRCTVK